MTKQQIIEAFELAIRANMELMLDHPRDEIVKDIDRLLRKRRSMLMCDVASDRVAERSKDVSETQR